MDFPNASALIQNLVDAGIATVVTGDQQPDAGSLISESDAAQQYFSDYDSYPTALDRFMADTIGDEEFILAYKWNDDTSSNVYSHVALYVGNGQVVAHGTTTDGTFATEQNTTPQTWNWYLNPGDGQNDWQVAIIALHSGTVNPPPTPAAAPDSSWTVSLSADQTDVTPGTVVNLTAQASQDVGPTPYSIAIVDQGNGNTITTCGSGSTCAGTDSYDSADSETYVAEIVDGSGNVVATSDPLQVTWEGDASDGTGGTGTNLGGVDLNGYCQSIGDQGVSLDGSTAYDWHCVDTDGNHLSIDMGAACQWQYSDPNASAVMGDLNDPDSWSCQDGELN